MTIQEINSKSESLKEQIKALQGELRECVLNAIKTAAEQCPYNNNKIGTNMYVIKYSDLIGKPWTPSFYFWDNSAKIVAEELERHNVENWCSILQGYVDNAKGESVEIKRRVKMWYGYTTDMRAVISREFVEKIMECLNTTD